jgi:hypothetical protein
MALSVADRVIYDTIGAHTTEFDLRVVRLGS